MNQQDADFPFAGLIIPEVRHEQVDEQDGADEIAGGEDGNMEAGPGWRPIDEKAAKKFVLGLVETEMHLGDGAPENNHATQYQARDGELEGRKELVKAFEHWA